MSRVFVTSRPVPLSSDIPVFQACASRSPVRSFVVRGLLCLSFMATQREAEAKRPMTPVSSSTAPAQNPPCSRARPAWAAAGSLVPGAVVHGSGHFINQCQSLGQRLFWIELAGVGLIATALAPAPIFGGNELLVPVQAFLGMSGVALVAGSFLLDVYGSFVPPESRGGSRSRAPLLESHLGYRYVYDPLFAYRNFVTQGFDLWYESTRFMPRAELSPDDGNARYRLPVVWRWFGPTPGRAGDDGSFADAVTAVTHQDFPRDGFRVTTLEAGVDSRMDLARLDPELVGTFAELGLGLGLNRYDYEAPGAGQDTNGLLLMSFAIGAYFGNPDGRGGELKLGYDHRHDDFAAGLKLNNGSSGSIGHFLIESRAYLDQWGLSLEGQVGSAYVMSASVLYRHGGEKHAD